MTFEKLADSIAELKEIAKTDTVPGEVARKLLQKDVTAHNVTEIRSLVEDFYRNR